MMYLDVWTSEPLERVTCITSVIVRYTDWHWYPDWHQDWCFREVKVSTQPSVFSPPNFTLISQVPLPNPRNSTRLSCVYLPPPLHPYDSLPPCVRVTHGPGPGRTMKTLSNGSIDPGTFNYSREEVSFVSMWQHRASVAMEASCS